MGEYIYIGAICLISIGAWIMSWLVDNGGTFRRRVQEDSIEKYEEESYEENKGNCYHRASV